MSKFVRLVCGAAAAAFLLVAVPQTADAAPSTPTFPSKASTYVAVAPCRVLDTRDTGRLGAAAQITVAVAGRCNVPADATAVAATVTAVAPSAAGYVTVWSSGSRPDTSTVNFSAGEIRANGAIVLLEQSRGTVQAFTTSPSDLVFDVTGYWIPVSGNVAAGRFESVTPTRLVDTRDRDVRSGGALTVASGRRGVSAVAVNITLVAPSSATYLTAHAAGAPTPLASVVNTDAAGQVRAASAIVPVDANGKFVVAQPLGRDGHVVVDLVGVFTGESATKSRHGLFVSSPTWGRVLDTRQLPHNGPGCLGVGASVPVTGRTPSWTEGAVVVGNLTLVNSFATAGYLTVASWGQQDDVPTSAVNAAADEFAVANLAFVAMDGSGSFGVRASHGADVLFDVSGWFTGPAVAATKAPQASCSNIPRPSDPWAAGLVIDCLSGFPQISQLLFGAGWSFQTDAGNHGGFADPDGIIHIHREVATYSRHEQCQLVLHEAAHAVDFTIAGWGPAHRGPHMVDSYQLSHLRTDLASGLPTGFSPMECVAEAAVFLLTGDDTWGYDSECGSTPRADHVRAAAEMLNHIGYSF